MNSRLSTARLSAVPDERGRFGEFGSRFVPETLMPALESLTGRVRWLLKSTSPNSPVISVSESKKKKFTPTSKAASSSILSWDPVGPDGHVQPHEVGEQDRQEHEDEDDPSVDVLEPLDKALPRAEFATLIPAIDAHDRRVRRGDTVLFAIVPLKVVVILRTSRKPDHFADPVHIRGL